MQNKRDINWGGMLMPDRTFSPSTFAGFNGKRMDNEISGQGNAYDFGARLYDPRTLRWNKPDEIKKPYESPFAAMHNNSILFVDPDGRDNMVYIFLSKSVQATFTVQHLKAIEIATQANYDNLLGKEKVRVKVLFDEDISNYNTSIISGKSSNAIIYLASNKSEIESMTDYAYGGQENNPFNNWLVPSSSSETAEVGTTNDNLSVIQMNEVTAGSLNASTFTEALAFTILHETGHQSPIFQGDDYHHFHGVSGPNIMTIGEDLYEHFNIKPFPSWKGINKLSDVLASPSNKSLVPYYELKFKSKQIFDDFDQFRNVSDLFKMPQFVDFSKNKKTIKTSRFLD